MNFRITLFFFGILLTTLWVFGLMIAHKKTAVDQTVLIPSLQLPDVKITEIQFKRYDQKKDKELPDVEFILLGDRWYYKDASKQQVRVEGFRIDDMIKQIKAAKNDETADVPTDPKLQGLKSPQRTVTLTGKVKDDVKTWTLRIGNESSGTAYVDVAGGVSPPDKNAGTVFAVARASIDSLFFEEPNHLRSKHLFNFTETAVTRVEMEKDGKKLELKRGDGTTWTFVEPPLGEAGSDEPVEEPKKDDFHGKPPAPKAPAMSGVKVLLEAVKQVRVEEDDDFVPLGKPHEFYGLAKDNAAMTIAIHAKDEKAETLLIGNKVRRDGRDYYYARMASDDGVMQISAKWLAPIDKAIQDPGKIRSLNVVSFDAKKVDAIVLKQGKSEIKFFRPEGETAWQMFADAKKHKADAKTIEGLLAQVQGKNAIVQFLDVPEADLKKKEAEWGLDALPGATVEIEVFVGAIEKDKKEDEKKDEAKDDKDKKDDKKVEKKTDAKDTMPTLKKDHKAVVTLVLGKSEAEMVNIRRKLESGAVSRFTLKKDFVEKAFPASGVVLAYLDSALPAFAGDDIVALEMFRTTDKGPEKLDLQRRRVDGKMTWVLKDPAEKTGFKTADENKVIGITDFLVGKMKAKKWLKKIDAKEDLDKYGLKNPVAVATIYVTNPAQATASLAGFAGGGFNPLLFAAVAAVAQREADKGDAITIKFGKETTDEKDKPGVYATHSKSDMIFLLPTDLLREFKAIDVYDRSFTTRTHPELIAAYLGIAAGNPVGARMLASPHLNGGVHAFDPDKVKEVRLAVRTPFELRWFGFTRSPKDKTWTESTGLQEFQLDGDKVTGLIKDIAKLRTDRFATLAGGPRMEHKLGAKEAVAKIDLTMEDGKIITLSVGTSYQAYGHFANSSYWPEAVFFVPDATIEPLLRGVAHFSKERTGLGPN